MTVTSSLNRITYAGDGSTTAFPVPFAFFAADELEVVERDTTNGAETLKALVSDYAVTGGGGATGTVTASAAPAGSVSWTIIRRTRLTQEIDYAENDAFPAESGLDRVTMIAQDALGEASRALRLPKTDAVTLAGEIPNSDQRKSRFLAFDAAGEPIASAGPTGSSAIPVSSYVETLLDDIDAAAARQTLGLVIGTDVAPAGAVGDFTGRCALYVGAVAPSGWLLLNGDTIGDTGSGATHEGPQFEDLFSLFWDSMADAQAPVSTGRGGSAAVDWAAGKTLTMPDARGRAAFATGAGPGLTARTHGDSGGSEDAALVAHSHGAGALAADSSGAHTHQGKYDVGASGAANALTGVNGAGNPGNTTAGVATTSDGAHTHTISGITASAGGAATDLNMPPWLALNLIIKY